MFHVCLQRDFQIKKSETFVGIKLLAQECNVCQAIESSTQPYYQLLADNLKTADDLSIRYVLSIKKGQEKEMNLCSAYRKCQHQPISL